MYHWNTDNTIHMNGAGSPACVIAAGERVGVLLGFVRNPKFHIVKSVACVSALGTP